MDRREQALEQLKALGVVVTSRQDVSALRTAISARDAQRRTMVFGSARQCDGKVRHSSEDKALKVARQIGNPEVRPYLCPHCGGRWWHNGNPPRGRG